MTISEQQYFMLERIRQDIEELHQVKINPGRNTRILQHAEDLIRWVRQASDPSNKHREYAEQCISQLGRV